MNTVLFFLYFLLEQAKVFSNDNPFQSVIPIKLAITPPASPEVHLPQSRHLKHLFYEKEILKLHGFVLDMDADSLFPEGKVVYSYSKPAYDHTQCK